MVGKTFLKNCDNMLPTSTGRRGSCDLELPFRSLSSLPSTSRPNKPPSLHPPSTHPRLELDHPSISKKVVLGDPVDELHFEDQRGILRDRRGGPAGAIGVVLPARRGQRDERGRMWRRVTLGVARGRYLWIYVNIAILCGFMRMYVDILQNQSYQSIRSYLDNGLNQLINHTAHQPHST